jgi:hypothetical protein
VQKWVRLFETNRTELKVIEQALKDWLVDCDLNPESTVLAMIAIKLAAEFDSKPHTSTAAELRKTILEVSRHLNGSAPEFDPLAEMLKR